MKYTMPFLFTLMLSSNAFSHGEDKPGPNGGYIRMPGAFHTELIPDKKNKSFHVFLLDIAFKNPTIDNSSLEMSFEPKGLKKKKVTFKCGVMGDSHYHCKPDGDYSSSGKLTLVAKREGKTGTTSYELPLPSFKDDTAPTEEVDHSSHH